MSNNSKSLIVSIRRPTSADKRFFKNLAPNDLILHHSNKQGMFDNTIRHCQLAELGPLIGQEVEFDIDWEAGLEKMYIKLKKA